MTCDTLQSTSNHSCPVGALHEKLKHGVQVWRPLLFYSLVVLSFRWVPIHTEVHWDVPFLGASVGKRMETQRE